MKNNNTRKHSENVDLGESDLFGDSHRRTELAVAISEAIRELAMSIMKKDKFNPRICLIEERFGHDRVSKVLEMSLRFMRDDEQWVGYWGGDPFSYWYGMRSAFQVYEAKVLRQVDESKIKYKSDCVCASQAALIMGGYYDLSMEVNNFCGVLAMLLESGRPPLRIGRDIDKFKILFFLSDCLVNNKIPTKKKILSSFPTMHASRFSRMINEMGLADLIPDETRARNRPKIEMIDLKLKTPDLEGFLKFAESNPAMNEIVGSLRPILIESPDIISHNEPEMVDCDIRIIKERMGVLYQILLHVFGMRDLASAEDLRDFDNSLKRCKLRLIRGE